MYNYAPSYYTFTGAALNNAGNVTNTNSTIDAEGQLVAGSDAINGGAPDPEYLDTDLTRNDVGCYGGSYSLANFPHFANTVGNNQNLGGRVYFFAAPRVVLQGQKVKIRASGFDR